MLEHIPRKELSQVLISFKKIKAEKLIVAQSAENTICKIAAFVSNRDAYININHINTTREVFKELYNHFESPEEYKRINLTHYITRYNLKEAKKKNGI